MNMRWLRRALVILVLAVPAAAYAARELAASDCPTSCPLGNCGADCHCPFCPQHAK
jgi:hypothetical protein